MIIGCRYYSLTRALTEKLGGCSDIKAVDKEMLNAFKGFCKLGAKEDEIITLKDPTHEALEDLLAQLEALIKENWDQRGETTLIYLYYVGHGRLANGKVAIVLDTDDLLTLCWRIEEKIRALGTMEGAYSVCLLDCS